VAKSDSPAIRAKTKELREELAHPDMDRFDRMMRALVKVRPGSSTPKKAQTKKA
jgi:hypothetical protein